MKYFRGGRKVSPSESPSKENYIPYKQYIKNIIIIYRTEAAFIHLVHSISAIISIRLWTKCNEYSYELVMAPVLKELIIQ